VDLVYLASLEWAYVFRAGGVIIEMGLLLEDLLTATRARPAAGIDLIRGLNYLTFARL